MSHEGPLLFMEGVGLARNEVGGGVTINPGDSKRRSSRNT